MALLASCWLITESFVIPHGFLKWFYLSFYIHPFFLVFCQIFLWLKVLKKWLMLFCYPLKTALRLSLFVFDFINRVVIFLFSSIKSVVDDDDQVYYDVLEPADNLEQISLHDYEIVLACNNRRAQPGVFCWIDQSEDVSIDSEINDHKMSVLDSWLNQYLYSDRFCMLSSVSKYDTNIDTDIDIDIDTDIDTDTDTDIDIDTDTNIDTEIDTNQDFIQETEDMLSIPQEHDSFSPVSFHLNNDFKSTTDDSHTFDDHQMNMQAIKDEDVDPFHQKYTSRMKFFNLLYHERLHGMSKNQH